MSAERLGLANTLQQLHTQQPIQTKCYNYISSWKESKFEYRTRM